MKISLDWLNDFLDLEKYDPETLAQEINEHCFEIEKIIKTNAAAAKFSNVFIAKVLEWQKHPNADRLRVVKLDLGGRIVEPVVCGANNFDVGDLVALALEGAQIPQDIHSENHEPFILGKAKIRGVESQGMICSAFELGLVETPEEKPEILLLPQNAPLGKDLAEYLAEQSGAKKSNNPFSGVVLDLALPANRPDLYSHVGIARELAGILNIKTKPELQKVQDIKIAERALKSASDKLAVEILNKQAAPCYIGIRIRVKVTEAPEFIKKRLNELGLRSINNVVDITNYVMYGLGEPLHAFDAAKVNGAIVVRNAKPGEKIVTIDHKERVLDESVLVIADQTKALAVAGIMGGLDSEVSAGTTEIILEAANFEPFQIRRASKKLGLRTDGSGFWEKGLFPEQAELGAARAVELLRLYASGEILAVEKIGDFTTKENKVDFDADQINNLLGTAYTGPQMVKLLRQLDFKFTGSKKFSVRVPYYRSDIVDYADLADEFIKITGMNLLEKQPLSLKRTSLQEDASLKFYDLKGKMVALGFDEVQNYSFVSEKDLEAAAANVSEHLSIKNPLSADQAMLKKDLSIPIIKNIRANSRNFDNLKIFEIGKGYLDFLNEPDLLSFAIYNKGESAEKLIAEAKGVANALAQKYGNGKFIFNAISDQSIEIRSDQNQIGELQLIAGKMLKNFDLENPFVIATLDCQALFELSQKKKYSEFSRFPEKVLDISLIVPEDLPWAKIEELVLQDGGEFLQSTEVFEASYLYGQNLPKYHKDLAQKGQKNLAFHLVFQAQNRTLTDSEILPIYDKIKADLKDKLGAEIR